MNRPDSPPASPLSVPAQPLPLSVPAQPLPLPPPAQPLPLPLPPRGDDVTLLQHGTIAPPSRLTSQQLEVELPDAAPPTPRVLPAATGARVSMPAMEDSSRMNPAPQLDRKPVPLDRRPMLEPRPILESPPGSAPSTVNTGSTFAGQHNTIPPQHSLPGARIPDPALMHPVRAPENDTRPPVGLTHESSDLIQTFDAGPDDSHPGIPAPAQPQKTIPPGSGMTIPPPGKILRHGPPAPDRTLRGSSGVQPPNPVAPANSYPPQPVVLPLGTEQMVSLVVEHRRRLHALDLWARALEIGAALAAVALVGALATREFVPALGFALGGLALAAQATTLRHVAVTSAQVSALIDALSRGR